MLATHSFAAAFDQLTVEFTNPAIVARIRRMAETFTAHEIQASLEVAVLEAADAAHLRAFEEASFGEASADAIVDAEYHEDLAAAWSLIAIENRTAVH